MKRGGREGKGEIKREEGRREERNKEEKGE